MKEKSPLKSFQDLERKTILLFLGIYTLLLALLFFFLPPLSFSKGILTNLFTKSDGPWPYLCGIFMINNAISIIIIYILKLETLYFDIIISRLINIVGLYLVIGLDSHLVTIFMSLEVIIIILLYLSVKHSFLPFEFPNNVESTGFIFSTTNLILYSLQTFIILYNGKLFSDNVLSWLPPPSIWSKYLGIIMFINAYLWFQAMLNRNSLYLIFYSLITRMTEIISLCGVILFYGINPTNYVLGFLFCNIIFMIWTILNMKEKPDIQLINKK